MDQATWMFWLLFPFGLLIPACLCASALLDLQDRNQNCFNLFPKYNFLLLPRGRLLLVNLALNTVYTGQVSTLTCSGKEVFPLLMSVAALFQLSHPQCVYSSIKQQQEQQSTCRPVLHLKDEEEKQSVGGRSTEVKYK